MLIRKTDEGGGYFKSMKKIQNQDLAADWHENEGI
jgi:hypothetical protein